VNYRQFLPVLKTERASDRLRDRDALRATGALRAFPSLSLSSVMGESSHFGSGLTRLLPILPHARPAQATLWKLRIFSLRCRTLRPNWRDATRSDPRRCSRVSKIGIDLGVARRPEDG
jgi:hypothetical protein